MTHVSFFFRSKRQKFRIFIKNFPEHADVINNRPREVLGRKNFSEKWDVFLLVYALLILSLFQFKLGSVSNWGILLNRPGIFVLLKNLHHSE